jgi:4-amino-4-deoxy-L-arabinose transferase-like glycosyltransferase
LPGLGSTEFHGEEPRRVAPALAMLETGNWIQPHIGGEAYFKKPPLVNWLIAGSITLAGGLSEAAARMPSVLVILALALTSYLTTRSWLGRGTAFGSALVLLTFFSMVDKGRLCEIESLLIAFTGMALLLWLQGRAAGNVSTGRWAAIGALLGLGMMAKGPIHLPFFYALVLWLAWKDGQLRQLFRWPHLAGIAVMVLPFYLWWLLTPTNSGRAQSVWVSEMTNRFSVNDSRNLLANALSSTLNLAPWVFLLVTMIKPSKTAATRNAWPANARIFFQVTLWFGLISVVLLPLVPGYRPRYSMPAFAALAVALAMLADGIPLDGWAGRIWRWLVLTLGIVAIPAGLASTYLNHFHIGWTLAGMAGVALGIGAVKVAVKNPKTSFARWQLSAVAAAAVALAAWGLVLLVLEKRAPLRENAARVVAQLSEGENVIAYRPGHLSFLVYLHDRLDFVLAAEKLPAGPVKVLILTNNLGELQATGREIRSLTEFKFDKRMFQVVQLGATATPRN